MTGRVSPRALEHSALVETALQTVVAEVEDNGVAENTLTAFCTDHGDAVGSNEGVANKGELLVEKTAAIPLLFSGPGMVAGRTHDELVSALDIAPTLLELCDLRGPPEPHGASLANTLSGKAKAVRDSLLVQHHGLQRNILQRSVYWERYKFVVQPDDFFELYDLEADPNELGNLALSLNDPPAPNRKSLVSEAISRLHALMANHRDTDNPVFEVLRTRRQ